MSAGYRDFVPAGTAERIRMLRAMDSAVAGLRAHQNKLDVIGNNIANVNTFGYKSQCFSFQEAMYQSAASSTGGVRGQAVGSNGSQFGYGTLMGSISMDMTASTPTQVGGLNACLNADGFFITSSMANKDVNLGGTAADNTSNIKGSDFEYTRVGKFQLDSQGYLTDGTNFVYGFRPSDTAASGFDTESMVALRVPSAATLTITAAVPPATVDTETLALTFDHDNEALLSSSIQINNLGEVTVTVPVTITDNTVTPAETRTENRQVSIGKVAVATFQNQEGLMKAGGTYYTASSGDNSGACSATVPGGSTASLMSGYLEASNVDLAREFSEMITTQRGFQANSKIITVSDEILSDLVNMKR